MQCSIDSELKIGPEAKMNVVIKFSVFFSIGAYSIWSTKDKTFALTAIPNKSQFGHRFNGMQENVILYVPQF